MGRSSTIVGCAVLVTASVMAGSGSARVAALTGPDDGSEAALDQFITLGEQYGYTLIDPACSGTPTEGTDLTYTCYAMTTLGDPFIARTSLSSADVVEFDIIAQPGQPLDPSGTGGGATDDAEPSVFDVLGYFAALFSGDPAEIATLQSSTAPGSPAEAYAVYHIEFAQTQAEHDGTVDPVSVFLTSEGALICVTTETCVHVTDLQVVDGQLVTFKVDGEDIGPRLGRPTPVVAVGTSTVQVRAAYRPVTSERLVVYVELTSTEQVTFELSTAVYVDAEGNQTPIDRDGSVGATDVALKGTVTAALVFPAVDPDGDVRFLVHPGDGSAPLAAVLPVEAFVAPAG